MTMTDPVADMLTRLRNANVAMHDEVRMPSSKLKEALAALLVKEGYIGGFEVFDDPRRPDKSLIIELKYSPDRERVISGLKRVSKPGLRVYAKSDRDPPGPRWPRHRRPVHQPGPHDRPRSAQAQRRRRGPLPGLVGAPCPESAKPPIPVPCGRRRHDRRPHVTVKGPKGQLQPGSPARSPSARPTASCSSSAPTTSVRTGRCTASSARSSTTWSSA